MRGICGRTRAEVFTDDDFYATGDVGHLDGDGFLFLTGRRDDMFKVRGATVYPSEVEGALHALAAVRRVFVVDVTDVAGAAEVAAVVVLADDSTDTTADELARDAKQRLSSFKIPTRWHHHRRRRRAHDRHGQGRQGGTSADVRLIEGTPWAPTEISSSTSSSTSTGCTSGTTWSTRSSSRVTRRSSSSCSAPGTRWASPRAGRRS